MTLSVNLTTDNGRRYMGFENDRGIKTHNWFTAIFAQIFGSGVVKMKDADGKEFYYNKGSLVKWIKQADTFVITKNRYVADVKDRVNLKTSDENFKCIFIYMTTEVRATMDKFAPKEAK